MEKPIEEAVRSGRIAPEEDVAGHGVKFKGALPPEEDVEGHLARSGRIAPEGDDDVDGHATRVKI